MRQQIICLTLLMAAAPAQAQIQWLNPVNGNWNVTGNWVGGNVPDTVGEIAEISVAGTYSVDLNFSPTIGGLVLTNSSATVNILNTRSLSIGGPSVTNNGLIVVNSTAGGNITNLQTAAAALAIGGAGVIRLNANPANLGTSSLSTSASANVLTLGAGQTVAGLGQVVVNTVNDGVIDADSSGNKLVLLSNPKTNNNIMRATNGGTLEVNGITITNNGQILADGAGASLTLNSATIAGGSISAINGGVGTIIGGISTVSDATFAGTFQIDNANTLSITGAGITNNGVITVNTTGGPNVTNLRTSVSAAAIGGAGTIRLNANPANLGTSVLSTSAGGNVLTLGAGQTVAGLGQITVSTVNNGVIDADSGGNKLALLSTPKTNNNIMRATNGGTLEINGITVTNNGQILADGAGAGLALSSATITGGSISAINGAVAAILGGTTTVSDATVAGTLQVDNASTLSITGAGITNSGVITINTTGGPSVTNLRTSVSAATIGGVGVIRLNANSANLGTSMLSSSTPGNVLTLGAGQTIAGSGRVAVSSTIQGTVSPGLGLGGVGRIEQTSASVTMTPTAMFEVDINGLGAGEFDVYTSTVGASLTIDGALKVNVDDGFTPVLGDEFAIMTPSTRLGSFKQIIATDPDPDTAWRVRYEASRAVLTVTCPTDTNGDHLVSLDDLATLLANYGTTGVAQGFQGDVDGDGDVDLSDLAEMLSSYGTSCP